MGRISNFARGGAKLLGAVGGWLTLFGTPAMMAKSMSLPPFWGGPIPSTTTAEEPDLRGQVIYQSRTPFTVTGSFGVVVCTGYLDNSVVQSRRYPHFLSFYYRIHHTSGLGTINSFTMSGFGGQTLRIAYRKDGPVGTAQIRGASRSRAPGDNVYILASIDCLNHKETPSIVIKTEDLIPVNGGGELIIDPWGDKLSIPTVRP